MSPRKIQAVARKEYYHLIRDFRSLYLAFIIPLVLILLFGYALSLDVEDIKTVVVDHDNTPLTRHIIQRLDASPYFTVQGRMRDSKETAGRLDRGQSIAALIFPAGWTADIRSDRETPLQVLLDGSDPNFAGITRAYVTAFIERLNQEEFRQYLNRRGSDELRHPVEARIRVWFNEDLESRNFILPGIIAIIVMIVGAMLTSLVIAREYENGTMETILSLPIGAGEFLLGKAIPYFFIGLIDVLIAVFMGQVLFGVVMKSSFWLMILASSFYLSVALSLGLLISSAIKSQLVANQLAILITYLPSLLLSDFVFPVENMPWLLQKITAAVPATYFINILNGIYLRGMGLQNLWGSYLILLLMAALLGFLNLVVLRKEGM